MSDLVWPTVDLTRASAVDLAHCIRTKEISPVEVIDAYLRRIEMSATNAVIVIRPEAVADARQAADAVARGKAIGPLHGVPFTAKDNLATAGITSTAGSRLLKGFVPASDAPAIARLRDAGAILLGKTNCPEFAMEPRTYNDLYGETRNPWDLSRSPGGSSGGEAAAQAEGCAAFGVGTDFGGSIRFPAHCTGIVGLRPTIGRVPASGQVSPSALRSPRGRMSVVGPMARSIADLVAVNKIMSGPDPSDWRSLLALRRRVSPGMLPESAKLRVAWSFGDANLAMIDDIRRGLLRAVRALEAYGVATCESAPMDFGEAEAVYARIRATDPLVNLRLLAAGREGLLTDRVQEAVFSPVAEVDRRRRFELLRARQLLRRKIVRFLRDYHALVLPVATTTALPLDATAAEIGGNVQTLFEILAPCRWISLFGLPAVSVPTGAGRGDLPVNVQVIARPWHEEDALLVAGVVENQLGGWKAPPVEPAR